MYQKLLSEMVTQIEKVPPLPHKGMEGALQTLENDKSFPEVWSWINNSTQRMKLGTNATSPENRINLFKSLLTPSSRHPLSNFPSIWTYSSYYLSLLSALNESGPVFVFTLSLFARIFMQKLTTLQPNPTPSNSTTIYSSRSIQRLLSVPSQSPPLHHWKQGTCQVDVHAAKSVQRQGLTYRKEGGWKKSVI